MPTGIPFIIGNELAERFSFYGMKAILVVFMTTYLVDSNGSLDVMGEDEAKAWYHTFTSAVYFTPLLGAIVSDWFLGKYRTILLLSLVYCAGHFTLAVDETRFGLSIGLGLIAIGAGGIKPCVSAHVGDQFGAKNSALIEKVFGWFYISINLGSAISTLLTPILLITHGPAVAFGIPGVLMLVATLVFWMGRNHFTHIPPGGLGFLREAFSGKGLAVIGQLTVLYLFVAVFWSLFDQTGSAWVLQARYMNLDIAGMTLLPSQVQAVNPILILILVPTFSLLVYPVINKFFKLTPLRKIGIGLFVAVPSFLIPAYVESQIPPELLLFDTFGIPIMNAPMGAFELPSVGWHLLAYVFITAAEVFISITCLEFSYTQAPKKMKSLMMGCYFALSVALGNAFTAGLNFWLDASGSASLSGPKYYLFFSGLMFATALLFVVVSPFYRGQTYIQGKDSAHAGPGDLN
jgi:POT family proton-dependent oligopeptide transporter